MSGTGTVTVFEGRQQQMPSGRIVIHKGTEQYLRSIGVVAQLNTAHEAPTSKVDKKGKVICHKPYYESP